MKSSENFTVTPHSGLFRLFLARISLGSCPDQWFHSGSSGTAGNGEELLPLLLAIRSILGSEPCALGATFQFRWLFARNATGLLGKVLGVVV